jgi:hypothetical protein
MGATGATGSTGATGATGTFSLATVVTRSNTGTGTTVTASCNAGETALGGGGIAGGAASLDGSRPDPPTGTPTGWTAFFTATGTNTAYVVCAS